MSPCRPRTWSFWLRRPCRRTTAIASPTSSSASAISLASGNLRTITEAITRTTRRARSTMGRPPRTAARATTRRPTAHARGTSTAGSVGPRTLPPWLWTRRPFGAASSHASSMTTRCPRRSAGGRSGGSADGGSASTTRRSSHGRGSRAPAAPRPAPRPGTTCTVTLASACLRRAEACRWCSTRKPTHRRTTRPVDGRPSR
mmetsp:Transcript_47123/g.135772  ORF Transcript_47123/g.135772 Transcript_47123/m.135772 type:complete len:201 (-) Transcript_47123:1589-2191(-)